LRTFAAIRVAEQVAAMHVASGSHNARHSFTSTRHTVNIALSPQAQQNATTLTQLRTAKMTQVALHLRSRSSSRSKSRSRSRSRSRGRQRRDPRRERSPRRARSPATKRPRTDIPRGAKPQVAVSLPCWRCGNAGHQSAQCTDKPLPETTQKLLRDRSFEAIRAARQGPARRT
jgi:hypothetical protein